jgi:hypothetical protein
MTVIENNPHTLVANFNNNTFIYDLPTAYGTPKSTISKIEGSDHDKPVPNGELTLRKKLFFKVAPNEREKHNKKTLAGLYDPDNMPEGLRKAHHTLDRVIEQCYRTKPFESDEEMTNKEK